MVNPLPRVPAPRRAVAPAAGAPVLVLLAAVVAACGDRPAPAPAPAPVPSPPPAEAARTAPPAAPSPRAEALYAKHCLACHGPGGRGDGPLARFLLPRPRNFVTAKYRITSTLQNRPTDADLLRTIRRGFPGTSMPSFGHLPEADLEDLVRKVKSLAATPIDAGVDPANPGATGPIPVPPEPADTPEGRARGAALYAEACAPCHGATGRGDGQQEQREEFGLPTWPRNFASGEWKGGSDGASLYRRIVGGMAGSPMPAAPVTGEDAWRIVHWVRSAADLDPEGRNEAPRRILRAARTAGTAPLDGDDPAWTAAGETWLALMPLWMRRTPRIHGIRVALLHDGERLSVRLRWADPTRDASSLGQAEFRDGAALQFGAGEDPPFFGMGGSGRPGDGAPVPIAMWKADRQEDAGGGSDLEARWPRACADGYPADGSAAGAVVPGLPLSRHDPLYLTGRAAGNGVSDLSGAAAVESLDSRGAGTLGFRRDGAAVEGKGTWKDGTWTVVFRRPLADAGSGGVALVPGGTASIAFAAWDGASGDRNGIKSVTAWHGLVVEEGGR